jgi:tetratricopeptide (TPR) repeat protein
MTTTTNVKNYNEQNNVYALLRKGNALAKQYKLDEAFKYYDLALKIEPKSIKALYNKAFALEHNYKLDEAMSYWEQVLEIDATDFLGLYGKAEILHKQCKLVEAIKAYNEVLKIKNYEDEELTLRSRARVLRDAIFYNLTDAVEELAKHCYFRKADLEYAIREKSNDEIINIIKNNIEEIKLVA